MVWKILVFIAILWCLYQFFYLAWNGIKYLKKEYKEIKKAFKESKKVKIEDKKLLWLYIILILLVILAVFCLLFHPMNDLEALGLVIITVGVWIVIALEKK